MTTLDLEAALQLADEALTEHAKTTRKQKWRSKPNHPGYKIVDIANGHPDYYSTGDMLPADSDYIAHAHEREPQLAQAYIELAAERAELYAELVERGKQLAEARQAFANNLEELTASQFALAEARQAIAGLQYTLASERRGIRFVKD